MALLLQRVAKGSQALSAREALEMGTLGGGGGCWGRDDIGVLETGMAADLIGIRLDRLDFAGAQADPLAALVFCTPPKVEFSIINGRVVIEGGAFVDLDLGDLVRRHNALSREVIG